MRDDVLVYFSAPLTEALEVTGPVVMKLYAATTAVDTDLTARLVDVHPGGYAQNIVDGIVRALSHGPERPAFPARTQQGLRLRHRHAGHHQHLFLPGHRIRLEISCSNFPRFDRNLNTGEDPVTGTRMEKAAQTVYHSPAYPSHVVLPVIPRDPNRKQE